MKKSVYLSIEQIARKWTMPIPHWAEIVGQLTIFFDHLDLAAAE